MSKKLREYSLCVAVKTLQNTCGFDFDGLSKHFEEELKRKTMLNHSCKGCYTDEQLENDRQIMILLNIVKEYLIEEDKKDDREDK